MALQDYYTNVYPPKCNHTEKYLESNENFLYVARCISLISLPFQLLTFHCILNKTPASMVSVKSSLLHLNFWYIFCGLWYSFVSNPYFLYPHMMGFYSGPLTNWGVSQEFQCFLALPPSFAMVFSFLILFENRSSLIVNNVFRFKSQTARNLWIFLNLLACFGLVTPIYFNFADSISERLGVLKILPCPPKHFFTEPFLVFPTHGFWKIYTSAINLLINGLLILQVLFFSFCCLYYLFHAKSSQVSAETRRLQIRSFFAIVLQLIIPIALLVLPLLLLSDATSTETFNQAKNNMIYLAVILHKGIASVCILLVHYPYRMYLISVIFCEKRAENKVTNVSSTATRA